jgi:hypothetical protein
VQLLALVDAGVTDRSELIERTVHYVPHGHAYRQREHDRADAAAKTERRAPERRQLGPRERCADDIYLIGARRVVSQTLRNLVRRGLLVRNGDVISRATRSARVTSAGGRSE